MKIVRHRIFKKNFKLRIANNPKLVKKFESRLTLYIKDSRNPTLKDHSLTGTKSGLREFSITGSIRIVYKRQKNNIILYDIGTHPQVYRM